MNICLKIPLKSMKLSFKISWRYKRNSWFCCIQCVVTGTLFKSFCLKNCDFCIKYIGVIFLCKILYHNFRRIWYCVNFVTELSMIYHVFINFFLQEHRPDKFSITNKNFFINGCIYCLLHFFIDNWHLRHLRSSRISSHLLYFVDEYFEFLWIHNFFEDLSKVLSTVLSIAWTSLTYSNLFFFKEWLSGNKLKKKKDIFITDYYDKYHHVLIVELILAPDNREDLGWSDLGWSDVFCNKFFTVWANEYFK